MYGYDFMESRKDESLNYSVDLKHEQRKKLKLDTEVFLMAGNKIDFVGNKVRDDALPSARWTIHERGAESAAKSAEYRKVLLDRYKAYGREKRRKIAREIYSDLIKKPEFNGMKKFDIARVVRGKMVEAFKFSELGDVAPKESTVLEYLRDL